MSVKRLYDDNLYQFDRPQPSYWEATASEVGVTASPLTSSESCDVAIIGGGYTGLSAALHLARDHDIDVRVLEAGHFGWGASGRNGGFCTMGGTGVHGRELIKLFGAEKARDYYRSQVEAVELVREIAGDEGIDILAQGNAEVEVAHTAKAFEGVKTDCKLLRGTLGIDAEILSADEVRERYYDSTEQFGAMISRPTFGLHPLRYCRGLANAAARRGATLHERSEVLEWSKAADGAHLLVTAGGTLNARRVLFATNGFMPEGLYPGFYGRTMPVVSAIVVTRPLTGAEKLAHRWQTEDPVINARRILNYYRLLPDDRFLFGGRGHTKGHVQGEADTYNDIIATMHRMWPEWSGVDIDYRWHGLICMTSKRCPAVGRLQDDPGVWFGHGYHGNGVNTATWAGKQLADWIGTGSEPQLPELVRGLGRKYPLARMRLKYLRLGIAISGWLDRRG